MTSDVDDQESAVSADEEQNINLDHASSSSDDSD